MHAADSATGLQVFKLHDLLGKLFSVGGAPTDGSLWPAFPRSSVRSDPAGSTRLPFWQFAKNCRSTEAPHQASSPRADSCGNVLAVGPRVRVARTGRQQRPFDDGRHRLSHSDALRDSAEAQRGRITSSRSCRSRDISRCLRPMTVRKPAGSVHGIAAHGSGRWSIRPRR